MGNSHTIVKQKIWVVSAYMTKNKTALHEPFDGTEVPPKLRPKTSVTSQLSYNSSITEPEDSGKTDHRWSLSLTMGNSHTIVKLRLSTEPIWQLLPWLVCIKNWKRWQI